MDVHEIVPSLLTPAALVTYKVLRSASEPVTVPVAAIFTATVVFAIKNQTKRNGFHHQFGYGITNLTGRVGKGEYAWSGLVCVPKTLQSSLQS